MSQHEFRVDLFVHADGTLAVHGGDVRGLVIEADDIREIRSELYRIVPRLLETNHGLSKEEIKEEATIRVMLRDAPQDSADETASYPRILWGDEPRITAAA